MNAIVFCPPARANANMNMEPPLRKLLQFGGSSDSTSPLSFLTTLSTSSSSSSSSSSYSSWEVGQAFIGMGLVAVMLLLCFLACAGAFAYYRTRKSRPGMRPIDGRDPEFELEELA